MSSRITLKIELLGGLRIRRGNLVIEHFQTQRTGALLAYLALHPERRHPREELIDLLWPDAPLDAGRHRLSQALSWLRPRLEDDAEARGTVLRADRQSISLNPAAIETDVAAFESALAAAHETIAPEARVAALKEAVNGYAGDLLPGYYDSWALAARERLLEAFLTALRRIVAYHEATQTPEQALDYARRAIAADPMSEEAHGDLIRLLHADGRPDAAMRHYRILEQILSHELQEAPSPATLSLAEHAQHSRPLTPSPPPTHHAPTALPEPLTRFFGRQEEVQQVVANVLSGTMRLISLIGPGGCGKTRLAIEAARHLVPPFQGAVWFVPLADLSDPAHIPAAVADALSLPHARSSSLTDVIEALAGRPALLVLDNLEHLADGAAPLVHQLLTHLPLLCAIVTTRQRLRLDGENEIPVPPLSLPDTGGRPITPDDLRTSASAQLFVDRVQAVRPAFQITAENAEHVAQLCRRLEGIPLALELCAAWAQSLSLEQMQSRLSQRFDLLVSRRTGIAARHRTLRAAVEYSHVQLPTPLKRLFARLSVFRGGWTLEAAEAVCRDTHMGQSPLEILTALTELRERSLITAEEAGGEMRFQMLETLREYAAEQLPPLEMIRRRRTHAVSYLALAERAEIELHGPDQAVWLTRLERDLDNLRAALNWASEVPSVDIGLRLAGALGPFWDARGYREEGQVWLDRLLALPGAVPAVRAKALNVRGHLARNQGAAPSVNAVMQEAVQIWREIGDSRGLAVALQIQATMAYSQEDCDQAQTYLTEALQLSRAIEDPLLVAHTLLNLGNIALEQGDWTEARSLYSESLTLYRRIGIPNRVAYALNNLGLVARYQGDLTAAEALLQECLSICRDLADRTGIAEALLNLGTVQRLRGAFDLARSLLREAAQIAGQTGEKRIVVWCLKEMGHIACAQEAHSLGVRLLASAESLRIAMGISFKPIGPDEVMQDLARAVSILGPSGYDSAWATGVAIPPIQALDSLLSAAAHLDGCA